jgi:hypothetical protein
MWTITRVQVKLSSVCSLIPFCGVVVYVVSCMTMKINIFCDMKPSGVAEVYRHFKGINFFLIRIVGGGVQMGPLGTSATKWPIVPAPGDYDDG